jgi:hypothetical protein
VILIKQCNSIQLAHLYEHLFCTAIDDLFYDNGLFPYLDYLLVGHTFHRGVVYIDLALYTDQAKELAKKVSALRIDLRQDSILIATTQLIAEKERPFGSAGLDAVKQALMKLHEQPWQDIDDLDIIDTKRVRRRHDVFYIAKGKPMPARKLTVTVSLDPDFAASHRELLPFFRQLSTLIAESFQADLAIIYGYYNTEVTTKNTRRAVSLSSVMKVAYGAKMDVADVLETVLNTVSDHQKYNAYTRLATELRTASHSAPAHLMPDPELMLKRTLVLIGAKGWKKTATEENCNLLLQHMTIEVKCGRTTAKQPVPH